MRKEIVLLDSARVESDSQIWSARSSSVCVASRKVFTEYHFQVISHGVLDSKHQQERCCQGDPHLASNKIVRDVNESLNFVLNLRSQKIRIEESFDCTSK